LIFFSGQIYNEIFGVNDSSTETHDQRFNVALMTFLMGLFGVFGSITSSMILDRFGRKNQLFITLSLYTIVMMIVGLMQ